MLTLVPLISTLTGPEETAGLAAAGAGLAWRMVMVMFCAPGFAGGAGGLEAGLVGGRGGDGLGTGGLVAGTLTCMKADATC